MKFALCEIKIICLNSLSLNANLSLVKRTVESVMFVPGNKVCLCEIKFVLCEVKFVPERKVCPLWSKILFVPKNKVCISM